MSQKIIHVWNKIDLFEGNLLELRKNFKKTGPVIFTSAKEEEGISDLIEEIKK